MSADLTKLRKAHDVTMERIGALDAQRRVVKDDETR